MRKRLSSAADVADVPYRTGTDELPLDEDIDQANSMDHSLALDLKEQPLHSPEDQVLIATLVKNLGPTSHQLWEPEKEQNTPKYYLQKKLPKVYNKANGLIRNKPYAVVSASLRKVINILMLNAQVNKSLSDAHGIWKLSLKDLKKYAGLNTNNFQHIEKLILQLKTIELIYIDIAEKGPSKSYTTVIPKATIYDNELLYELHRDVVQLIANAPSSYTKLLHEDIRKLSKVCSIPLFELCMRYSKLGVTPWFPWEQIRDEFVSTNIIPKNAETWTKLNKYYIMPAQEEVNEKGIIFVKQEKQMRGKSVAAIRFLVTVKPQHLQPTDPKQATRDVSELSAKLRELGVADRAAGNICKLFSYEEIEAAIAHTMWRISNTKLEKLEVPARYLRRSLNDKLYLDYINKGLLSLSAESIEKLTGIGKPPEQPPLDNQKSGTTTPKEGKERLYKLVERKRMADIKAIVNEMPESELAEIFEEYNQTVSLEGLKMDSTKKNKISNMTLFSNWYSKKLWGDITSDEIVDYVSSLQGPDSLFN